MATWLFEKFILLDLRSAQKKQNKSLFKCENLVLEDGAIGKLDSDLFRVPAPILPVSATM